jgi:hypothetical protein
MGKAPKSDKNSLVKTEMSAKTRAAFRTNTYQRKASVANLLDCLCLCFWMLCAQVSWAQRVAIFDYDDRNPFPDALALHIEEKLQALSETIDKEGVSEGAVAAMSSDFFKMADKLLIPMARKVLLENVDPGDMPAAFLEQKKVFINTCQAKKLGLDTPFQILIDTYEMEVEEICQ